MCALNLMSPDGQIDLQQFARLEAVRDEWHQLASRSGNLFATWEWASTWWRHFGAGRPLLGTVVRHRGDDPAAIIPLYLSRRRPLAVLRFVGDGPGDWVGPIHAPGDARLAAAGLRAALASTPEWDLLLGQHLRADERWAEQLGAAVVRHEGFPRLSFHGHSWDDFLGQRSANFREQVRRRERRLARNYRLAYRLSDDPDRLDADLELLFQMHAARWHGEAIDALQPARQFHRDFARLALERGWLRLWVMSLDDVPVAVWYGFRFAEVEWYYQGGWDPVWSRASPGFVLLCHTIREALEDGAQAYWFLRGGDAYKARFADDDPGVETLVLSRHFRGRVALAAIKQVDRLPHSVRQLAKLAAG